VVTSTNTKFGDEMGMDLFPRPLEISVVFPHAPTICSAISTTVLMHMVNDLNDHFGSHAPKPTSHVRQCLNFSEIPS
jgi:hypothetical protein